MSAELPPLPEYKHLPGINDRPDDGLLESIAKQAPAVTQDVNTDENTAWSYGIRLINNEFFWEAHEVLEVVWMRAPPNSRERFLVQCLIHLTNAALKQRLEKPNAAKRLCDLAEQCRLRAFPRSTVLLMGINATQLQASIQDCQQFKGSVHLLLNKH